MLEVVMQGGRSWGCGDAEGVDDEEAMGQRSCRHRRRSGHSHTSSTSPDITGITHYSSQSSHRLPDIYWSATNGHAVLQARGISPPGLLRNQPMAFRPFRDARRRRRLARYRFSRSCRTEHGRWYLRVRHVPILVAQLNGNHSD